MDRFDNRDYLAPVSVKISQVLFVLALLASIGSTTAAAYAPAIGLDSSFLRQTIYVGLIASLAGLVALNKWKLHSLLPIAIFPSLAWFALTLLESSQFGISLARLSLVAISSLVLFGFGAILGRRRAVTATQATLLGVVAVNILVSLLAPAIGINDYAHSSALHQWRGIFAEKNEAGAVAAILVLVSVFGIAARHSIVRWAGICFGTIFLLMSQSRTAIIMCVVAAAVTYLLVMGTKRRPGVAARPLAMNKALIYAALPVIFTLVASFAISSDWFSESVIGGPKSFSNRGYIWLPMIDQYMISPHIGVGFGSYWTTRTVPAGAGYDWLATVGHGHNGYLDLLVQVGWPGLMLVVLGLVAWPLFLVLRKGFNASDSGLMAGVSITIFALGSNLTESGMLNRDVVWNASLILALSIFSDFARVKSNQRNSPSSSHLNNA